MTGTAASLTVGSATTATTAATVTTAAQPNITSVGTLTSVSVSGNTTSGNILTGGLISATGNITGGNANIGTDLFVSNSIVAGSNSYGTVTTTQFAGVFAKAAGLNATSLMQVKGNDGIAGIGMRASTGVTSLLYSNAAILVNIGANVRDLDVPSGGTTIANISSTGLTVTGLVSASGNVTGGNIRTAGQVSATGNITGGNLLTGAQVVASGVIQTGTGFSTGGYLSVDGGTDLHNTTVTGTLSATGNVTGNYILGNGSQLTGVVASSGAGNLWVVGRIATYYVPILSGILTVVGRTGNISIAINA